jgi:hypothetical protein
MATAKQIAARKRFTEMAKSGKLAQLRKKAAKQNPAATVSQEISAQIRKGKPQRQAVAIALDMERKGKLKKNPDGKKFTVGKYYETRSIIDSDTRIGALILDRTDKSVTVRGTDNLMKQKYRLTTDYQGNEMFFPWGRYSMAPQITADDLVNNNPTPTKGTRSRTKLVANGERKKNPLHGYEIKCSRSGRTLAYADSMPMAKNVATAIANERGIPVQVVKV